MFDYVGSFVRHPLCHKVPAEVRKKQLRAARVLQQKAVPRADLTSVWLAPHMHGLCRGFALPTRLAEYSACECRERVLEPHWLSPPLQAAEPYMRLMQC